MALIKEHWIKDSNFNFLVECWAALCWIEWIYIRPIYFPFISSSNSWKINLTTCHKCIFFGNVCTRAHRSSFLVEIRVITCHAFYFRVFLWLWFMKRINEYMVTKRSSTEILVILLTGIDIVQYLQHRRMYEVILFMNIHHHILFMSYRWINFQIFLFDWGT